MWVFSEYFGSRIRSNKKERKEKVVNVNNNYKKMQKYKTLKYKKKRGMMGITLCNERRCI